MVFEKQGIDGYGKTPEEQLRNSSLKMKNKKIAVVGLGYVGLPIAVAFGKKFATMGFDLDQQKIENYKKGVDPTGELNAREFSAARHLEFSAAPESIKSADFIIVTVPTPIDE